MSNRSQNIISAHLRDAKMALAVHDAESAVWSATAAMSEAKEADVPNRASVCRQAKSLMSAAYQQKKS